MPTPSAESTGGAGHDETEPPGEGGGSRAKADKALLKTMAFELPNYAQALAWGAEPAGKYGSVPYLFEVEADGRVTACRPGPKDPDEVPPLIRTTLERLCKRLARGTYALGEDGLVSRGAQRVIFDVQLSDVPVSDAPADGYAIANRPKGRLAGEIEITLVGGRRVVFSWRADEPKLMP